MWLRWRWRRFWLVFYACTLRRGHLRWFLVGCTCRLNHLHLECRHLLVSFLFLLLVLPCLTIMLLDCTWWRCFYSFRCCRLYFLLLLVRWILGIWWNGGRFGSHWKCLSHLGLGCTCFYLLDISCSILCSLYSDIIYLFLLLDLQCFWLDHLIFLFFICLAFHLHASLLT
jgi:hypothetical protein